MCKCLHICFLETRWKCCCSSKCRPGINAPIIDRMSLFMRRVQIVGLRARFISLSVSICVFVLSLFLLQGDESLIPRGLLVAMTSDPFQNNNIQSAGLFTTSPLCWYWKPFDIALLIFIHIASSVFFGSTSTKNPSRKESVFFKTNLTVVNTAEMPLWSDFSQQRNVSFLKTHTPPEELRSSQPTTVPALGIVCNHKHSAFFFSLGCTWYRLLRQSLRTYPFVRNEHLLRN